MTRVDQEGTMDVVGLLIQLVSGAAGGGVGVGGGVLMTIVGLIRQSMTKSS